MSSFLPWALGPQLDTGRLGGTWCDPDNTQLLSPPTLPRRLCSVSSLAASTHQHLQRSLPLWRTTLWASPITQCSGQAAGVTAHMSQHDRGVSCHACPLTFPTFRVHAGSEKRGGKKLPCFLFGSLSATIWSALPLSLSHSSSVSLALALLAHHWGCLWLRPRQVRALWFKPRACCTKPWTHFEAKLLSFPSTPPIPLHPPLPPTPLPPAVAGEGCFLAGNE